ncbi:MAG: hypothetical protein GY845_17825 [Planctomycetes bacterium]|nr:hypothetical protein [Planctomycetota bacterium]
MVNHRMSSKLLVVLICMAWCPLVLAQGIPDGPYLGQVPPGDIPQLFAPGIVTLANSNEFNGSFTPDGQEFYFTAANPNYTGDKVMMTHQRDGSWTTPEVAPFSGQYIDWGVYPSPDGRRLFFGSSRPNHTWLTFNIWMCERQGSTWSEPVKLGLNSSSRDYAGTCTLDGTYYFLSERDGGTSIFRSVPVNGAYTQVEKLPNPINNGTSNLDPYIAPDESYLIFASNRQGDQDLYISYRNEDDLWTEPVNLGPGVNTPDTEWNPFVSPDGQYLFFARSTGPKSAPQNLDLYWVDIGAVIPDTTDPNGMIRNLRSKQRFSSIQGAIIYANQGDTLILEPGVYQETINLNKNIVIQSVDPNDHIYIGSTIIQAEINKPVLTLGDNTWGCEIAGLTLRAGLVGIEGTATNATVRNCRIMDNVTHGIELSQVSSPHLLGCLITANGQAGIKMHATNNRRPLHCKPVIEDCTIVDNGEAALVGGEPVIVDSMIQGQ